MSEELKPEQQSDSNIGEAVDRNELLEKLRRLEERRAQVEADKRNAASAYNDELKEIKAELGDTLVLLKGDGSNDADA